ncbi:alkaline phosphatase family protein [Sphingomonas japonica]|uniref:Alkaline phosphatase n=1 Tax=Sphingomonas japonica TaxID=511662 RepID=A0ABX0U1Q2_9SPHN|nr:alkaline phosphatase family protein [Sphingomonas japonica]NIJ24403.1 putative AlkP superfamily pyrophosphatase or phosphodiesterase [Sphingomonas japonica]
MSRLTLILSASLCAAVASPVAAQEAPVPERPRLIVAIAVDQFSADLFDQYRSHVTGGLARLARGVVFPSGYQPHSATETCPGHATILTGSWPSRTGIIANDWIDLDTAREDKTVYCLEDESVPGSNSDHYTVSPKHLRMPTLGDRMKAVAPATRVVAVSGKDRGAVAMGGKGADQTWWWGGKGFVGYVGAPVPNTVTRTNAAVTKRIATAQPALALPAYCQPLDRAIPVGGGRTVGTGRFARAAGNASAFANSPEKDAATLALAAAFVQDLQLGQRSTTDLLAVSLSATDHVGHSYGTNGAEMCLQLTSLDRDLGNFFDVLDATGIDYAVVLTADHGGHDLPERNRQLGIADAQRVDPALAPSAVGKIVAGKLGLAENPLFGGTGGDIWIDPKLTSDQRAEITAATVAHYRAQPQVAAILTRAEIEATPRPTASPELWTVAERARATYVPDRSGDLMLALKPHVTPIPHGSRGSVATHGSFWDYDRRVPILFWREGLVGFEQPVPVQVADILPSLAGWAGITVPSNEIDGTCRDLIAGPQSSCR